MVRDRTATGTVGARWLSRADFARVRWAPLLALLAGCAVHLQGVIEPIDGRPRLWTAEGRSYRLVLLGDAAPVGQLGGHLVAIEGERAFGAVRVGAWQVLEGPHGMSTWAGRVAAMGSQIGIEDRGSGAFYWVDDATARSLRDHVGEIAVVEGYVDGPHRVRAVHVQVLSGT